MGGGGWGWKGGGQIGTEGVKETTDKWIDNNVCNLYLCH